MTELRLYPPYLNLHTRETVPGAWPSGTRVMKIGSTPGDVHRDGDLATVLGSVTRPLVNGLGYFVEWDSHPLVAVLVMSHRCQPVS